MFSHVTVGSNDIAKAKAFYDGVTAPLGLVRHADYPDGGRLWPRTATGRDSGSCARSTRRRRASATASPSVWRPTTALRSMPLTPRRLKAGGKDEGAPGMRKHYHPNYYGAYVRDLDGNKVCIVCHKPA